MLAVESHLLVVDDDPEIGVLLQQYFEKHGFAVSVAKDAQAMATILSQDNAVDLILLDMMMPGENGLQVCKKMRGISETPIIMLTAIDDEAQRITALELGADDYVTKPFSPPELLARVKAVLRRVQGDVLAAKESPKEALFFLGWYVDQARRRLHSPEGVLVSLSTGEYDLLMAFLAYPQKVLSREKLMQLTKSRQLGLFDRAMDVQVSRLRRKIENDPKNPKIIMTVRGGGYQFMASVTQNVSV